WTRRTNSIAWCWRSSIRGEQEHSMTRTAMLGATLIAAATVMSVAGAEPDFSAGRIKAHVTFLADDLLEGRETGTRGHEIAARYIASQFALLGVKPGGPDGGYFQTVNF